MECNYTIYSFQELSSTNTYAKEQLSSLPDRSVITADCQTAGKGRMGKNWSSPPGLALYLTFVLKNPPFDISMLPLISGSIEISNGGFFNTNVRYRANPGGLDQFLPIRPLPAVWQSAVMTLRSGREESCSFA